MAVDLADLIDSLRAKLSEPGGDLFPAAVEDDWIARLANGFWRANMAGLFANYREVNGRIEPLSGTTDLPRREQQAIVMFAAYDTVWSRVLALPTAERSRSGPVETETQYSAQVLQLVLNRLEAELDRIVANLGTTSSGTRVFDAVAVRLAAFGPVPWVN